MNRFLLALGLSCVMLCLFQGNCTLAQARKTGRNVPPAPLPTAITAAKKVYLLDGQTTSQYLTKNGNALAFDAFYADMKNWGRYELTSSPKAADIVIELQYRPYSRGSSSYGVYNPSSQTVQTYDSDSAGADFALVIYEATSKEKLWSASDACGFARLAGNQRKEVVKSIDRLVNNLKLRTEQPS